MKSILCLATVCLFALASSAAADIFSNTDSGYMGTISVPQVFLVHKFPAKLKIYIINPRAKITLPLDAEQLVDTIYFEVSEVDATITDNPKFPNTALEPSTALYSLSSNVVIEIWDQHLTSFVGGSVLTFGQAEQLALQTLTLQNESGTFVGVAQLAYKPPSK